MQLDYTAIIPNDRFEKPVDRDDDVTQEESYVVVCVCVCVEEMCLCGGVNSIGKTKIHLNSFAFNNFISEIRDGQDNAVRRRISSWNLLFKKIMCTHCKDDIEKKKKKSNFQWILIYLNQLWPQHTIDFEKILVSLSKENCSTSSFASLTYDSIWRMKYFFGTSIGLNRYTFFVFGKKKSIWIFSFWI